MTGFIIDAAIVLVVLFCAYRGFRAGVVRGIAGFVALILSLVIASTVSRAFASEFTGVLRPFVGGLVDSQVQKVLTPPGETPIIDGEEVEEEAPELPADEEYDSETTYGMAMATLRKLGFFKPVAEAITKAIESETQKVGYALSETITAKLCLLIARVALFAVSFILLAIIFSVLGNLINVVFSLPGLRTLDQIAGTAMGLLRGLLIIFFVATLLRYFGLIAANTIEKTSLLEYMVIHNPIANAMKM
ncbi:MAG: CvpA family protein [Oscillospiraceae bacterium]|jgi:uncharacterized membrane protein required for colicin V production|nr:CvpA family protein [Oscillospiraceae bacterium]